MVEYMSAHINIVLKSDRVCLTNAVKPSIQFLVHSKSWVVA